MKIPKNFNVGLAMPLFALLVIGALSLLYNPESASANVAPPYTAHRHASVSASYADTTVSTELLRAPGAGYDWWIEKINISVLDNEAAETIIIEDAAGTAVNVAEYSVAIAGNSVTFDFGRGVMCSTNSAVNLEFTGTSTEVFLNVTAHTEKH